MVSLASRTLYQKSVSPDRFERILAAASLMLLACVVTALVRGSDEWARVPSFVWAHLLTIIVALGLTPVMLVRRRGDRMHRQLGWLWAGSMLTTALFSFGIRDGRDGDFSVIHILSLWTIVQVPLIV